jgi:hypothetical protein
MGIISLKLTIYFQASGEQASVVMKFTQIKKDQLELPQPKVMENKQCEAHFPGSCDIYWWICFCCLLILLDD